MVCALGEWHTEGKGVLAKVDEPFPKGECLLLVWIKKKSRVPRRWFVHRSVSAYRPELAPQNPCKGNETKECEQNTDTAFVPVIPAQGRQGAYKMASVFSQ